MKYLGLRKYIVDVCNAIDTLFGIALIAFFLQWCFGYEVETYKWGIAIIGVLLWPAKRYWKKWLHVTDDNDQVIVEFKKGE